jgi:STE24 endopeptidase
VNEDRSTRYQRQRRRAAIATATLDAALLAFVLVTGLSRAIADAASAAWTPAPAATLAFVLALLAVRTALVLPVAYSSQVVHERRYGRAQGPVVRWFGVYLWRAAMLAAPLAAIALVLQASAWWSPSAWWAPASVAMAAAVVCGAALVPAMVARSGAELAPIRRADLAARLTALAARAGAAGFPILEWKVGEARGAGATALLAGIGPSRRILVTDAVLDTHADDEVEVIVAHELAHHRRGDVWWTAAITAGVLTLGLYAAERILSLSAGMFALRGPSDAAALPLIALVCGVVAAALTPIVNALSRAQERRADRDALRWTGNAPALVRTLKRLAAAHLAEDRPPGWAEAFFQRHPGVLERIAAAERWEEDKSQVTIHKSQTVGLETGDRRPETIATQGAGASGDLQGSPSRSGEPAPATRDHRAAVPRAAVRPAGRRR